MSAPPPARPARAALDALLSTDARDPGCDEAFALVHRYVEILDNGRDPDAELPDIGAHLRSCPPCAEDLVGLLAAMRAEGRSQRS